MALQGGELMGLSNPAKICRKSLIIKEIESCEIAVECWVEEFERAQNAFKVQAYFPKISEKNVDLKNNEPLKKARYFYEKKTYL